MQNWILSFTLSTSINSKLSFYIKLEPPPSLWMELDWLGLRTLKWTTNIMIMDWDGLISVIKNKLHREIRTSQSGKTKNCSIALSHSSGWSSFLLSLSSSSGSWQSVQNTMELIFLNFIKLNKSENILCSNSKCYSQFERFYWIELWIRIKSLVWSIL